MTILAYDALNGDGLLVLPCYTLDATASRALQARLSERCDAFCETIDPDMDAFGKARAVCDWMLANAAYDLSAPNGQTIRGALVDRRAVCKGCPRASST